MKTEDKREQQQLWAAIACMFLVVFIVGWLGKPHHDVDEPDIIEATNAMVYSWDDYTEITYINSRYDAELDSMGVEYVTDYDWEETANALDIDVEDMTIQLFMDHMRGR